MTMDKIVWQLARHRGGRHQWRGGVRMGESVCCLVENLLRVAQSSATQRRIEGVGGPSWAHTTTYSGAQPTELVS